MKVAVVTSFPDEPASPKGGVEAVSIVLIDALLAFADLDVHVVTLGGPGSAPRIDAWRGATIHRLPRTRGWMLIGALGADRRTITTYLRSLAPDVVHAHDTYGLMVHGLAIPRVFTIHGFIHADTALRGGALAQVRARAWRVAEHRSWAGHPHIISISPYVRERLRGIATGVIHDIENPVARPFFDIQRRNGAAVVFSAAAICRRKNTAGLVEAFAQVVRSGVDARLRLAGAATEPDYDDALRARIRALGLEPRVERLGPLSSAAVGRELSEAAVFALVSREENSPLGVQEAMAAGVPVVTSNRCGMPYLVRDGETGSLIDPEDPTDIAARLTELLTDPALARRMGEHARAFALERFHPDVVARRTRAVYDRVLGSRKAVDAAGIGAA